MNPKQGSLRVDAKLSLAEYPLDSFGSDNECYNVQPNLIQIQDVTPIPQGRQFTHSRPAFQPKTTTLRLVTRYSPIIAALDAKDACLRLLSCRRTRGRFELHEAVYDLYQFLQGRA